MSTTQTSALGAPQWQSALLATPAWGCIELVSDIHLTPSMPKTAAAFSRYLQHSRADAILILGDLFEVWIGNDVQSDVFAMDVMSQLAQAARHRCVALMVGNRDFLLSPALLAMHGVLPLGDPTLLTAFDQSIVLSHGDVLCLDDMDYQRFRLQVREPSWQQAFLAKPRPERAQLARGLRDASEARKHADQPVTFADADPGITAQWLRAFGANALIHGHTHRPCTHKPAVAGAPPATERHVLSDWDLDGTKRRAQVLQLRASGFTRVVPDGVQL